MAAVALVWEIVAPLVSGGAMAAAVLSGRRRVRRRREGTRAPAAP